MQRNLGVGMQRKNCGVLFDACIDHLFSLR